MKMGFVEPKDLSRNSYKNKKPQPLVGVFVLGISKKSYIGK